MVSGTTMIKTLKTGTIEQPHLLLVEGIDDAKFFEALLEHLNLKDIEIWPIGCGRKFKEGLRLLTMLSGFERVISVGIIRDADNDPVAAFDSVSQALRDNGLSAPNSYGRRSTGTPITCIMIMPDGLNSQGMLESLCLRAIKDDPAMPCINAYFDCLSKCNIFQRTVDEDKAKVHAYLASKYKPDKRLGESALANYWPFDNGIFDEAKRFLFEIGNT
jgi:hypothetical protein